MRIIEYRHHPDELILRYNPKLINRRWCPTHDCTGWPNQSQTIRAKQFNLWLLFSVISD